MSDVEQTRLVLTVDWKNRNLVVDTILVDSDHQSMGVGRKLLQAAEEACALLALDRVVVECSSRNTGALNFYDKTGYKEVSRVLQKRVDIDEPIRTAGFSCPWSDVPGHQCRGEV